MAAWLKKRSEAPAPPTVQADGPPPAPARPAAPPPAATAPPPAAAAPAPAAAPGPDETSPMDRLAEPEADEARSRALAEALRKRASTRGQAGLLDRLRRKPE